MVKFWFCYRNKGSLSLLDKTLPPSPLYTIVCIWLDTPFMHTCFLYIHTFTDPASLLINFYSDLSFCHSQYLGYFHFCFSLRLNFTKPISKRFSIYSLRTAYNFLYTIINDNVIAAFVQKRKVLRFCSPKKFFCVRTQPWIPLSPASPSYAVVCIWLDLSHPPLFLCTVWMAPYSLLMLQHFIDFIY